MSATATPAKVSREMLEDRWAGLMPTGDRFGDGGEDIGKVASDLYNVLEQVYAGVARQDPHETRDFPIGSYDVDRDGVKGDLGGFVLEELVGVIRGLETSLLGEVTGSHSNEQA